MRRAVQILALAALILSLPGARPARAQEPEPVINAIGLIDFGHKPDFHVGSYAKYHMVARNDIAVTDDYTLTVMIPGEERWWGEDCFWIETWTEKAGGRRTAVASLMSYDVFKDSLALTHAQLYVRKLINVLDDNGLPVEEVYKRPATALRTRESIALPAILKLDTLGHERLTTPKGTFDCVKIQMMQGKGRTGQAGDSTDYQEFRETRTVYMTSQVPVTHSAREDVDNSMTRKAWKVGYSAQATPMATIDHTRGSAELVDAGDGAKSRLMPESMQVTLAQYIAAHRPGRATAGAAAARSRPARKKTAG